jgi:hypothetical protein
MVPAWKRTCTTPPGTRFANVSGGSEVNQRRNVIRGLLGWCGLAAAVKAAPATQQPEAVFNSGLQLFFAQRDMVINFDQATGIGNHIGTVEGAIAGTSIVNFQFIPTSQTTIKYDNRALISDIDGDQIIFQVIGVGRFIVPPPADTTSPLGNLMVLGGPLVATYVALQATGKYAFLVGRKFPCKMMATNAVKASPGSLGNVYVEVYSDSVGVLASALQSYPK